MKRTHKRPCDRATSRIASAVGPDRDIVQAYCDLLEHKWLLSERAGHDVGMQAALDSYLASGAPAPEVPGSEASGAETSEAADAADAAEAAEAAEGAEPSGASSTA